METRPWDRGTVGRGPTDRRRHGGFGVFFETGGAGVVRGISQMWDETNADGRHMLSVGDTVVRVGGYPTATAIEVADGVANG